MLLMLLLMLLMLLGLVDGPLNVKLGVGNDKFIGLGAEEVEEETSIEVL